MIEIEKVSDTTETVHEDAGLAKKKNYGRENGLALIQTRSSTMSDLSRFSITKNITSTVIDSQSNTLRVNFLEMHHSLSII